MIETRPDPNLEFDEAMSELPGMIERNITQPKTLPDIENIRGKVNNCLIRLLPLIREGSISTAEFRQGLALVNEAAHNVVADLNGNFILSIKNEMEEDLVTVKKILYLVEFAPDKVE